MKSLITRLSNRHHVLQLVQVAFTVLILMSAGIFPLRLLSVVLGVGENNLSNDYLAFTGPVIQIADKGMQINDLYKACFGIQCEPLTLIVMALGVRFFDWNVRAEIIFSVLVSIATAFLIYFAIAGITFRSNRIWLLLFISAFSFSFTLMATYTFGQAAIYTTLALFGIALGIFAVTMFPNSAKGFILLIVGMWVAMWSYGAGLFSIPIALWGVQIGFRNIKYYVLWFIALLIISIPYLQFFIHSNASNATNIISLLRIEWILKLLGSFFSNKLWFPYPGKQLLFNSVPTLYGVLGVIFLSVGLLAIIYSYGWKAFSIFYTECSLIFLGLGSVWLASVFRDVIAPWYVINAMPFWLGLVCLYYSFIVKIELIQRNMQKLIKWITLIFLSVTTILFFHSNLTYEDKVFHLLTRSPASASCLRNSFTAPTYCEPFLFQWTLGNPQSMFELGRPLYENKLSVYSSKQEWTLQGDYLLNSVQILPSPSGLNPYWIDANDKTTSWRDYHRLNLIIPSGAMVNWKVQIPRQATTVSFKTQLKIYTDQVSHSYENSLFSLSVNIKSEDGQVHIYTFKPSGSGLKNGNESIPVVLSLEQFSGQRISLSLYTTDKYSDSPGAVLIAPTIDVIIPDDVLSLQSTYQPENVYSLKDPIFSFDFWPSQNGKLILRKIENDKYNFYQKSSDASMVFESENKPCVYDSTNLYITISIDKKFSDRYGYFVLLLKDQSGNIGKSTFLLPYLADDEKHTYTFPLKLDLVTSPSYLEMLEIRPVGYPGAASFRIEKIGLFDNKNNINCYSGSQ